MKPVVLFHVVVFALVGSGCGYSSVRRADAERLHVALRSSHVADAVATDSVLAGIRSALSEEGALAAGDGYPRVEVEVLRADETSDGIQKGLSGAPIARATEIALVGRACVVQKSGAECLRDTGDVRVADTLSTPASSELAMVTHGDTLRAAGTKLGRALGRRILGNPQVSENR